MSEKLAFGVWWETNDMFDPQVRSMRGVCEQTWDAAIDAVVKALRNRREHFRTGPTCDAVCQDILRMRSGGGK